MVGKRRNYTKLKAIQQNKKRKITPSNFDRKKNNLKFIKRSKEAEDTQRRQKILEDKYKQKTKITEYSSSEEEEQDENPFDQLISSFHSNKDQRKEAIESSSDEDDVLEDRDDSGKKGMEEENQSASENEEEFQSDYDNSESSDNSHSKDYTVNPDKLDEIDDDSSSDSNEYSKKFRSKKLETSTIDVRELKEEIQDSKSIWNTDPFAIHIEKTLSPSHIENLLSKPPEMKTAVLIWPTLGNITVDIVTNNSKVDVHSKSVATKSLLLDEETEFATEGDLPILDNYKTLDLTKCYIKSQIQLHIFDTNKNVIEKLSDKILTPLQTEFFSIMNNYQDFYYSQRTLENANEIRVVYCLHVLNHMLKTRTKILHHNSKLLLENKKNAAILSDSYRDQGFVRPKILILLPFRESAYRVINILANLLFGVEESAIHKHVLNYNRFVQEFTGDTIHFPKKNSKPEDYEKIFSGNTDDTFRIGISLTKKTMKLYTEFYASDILLASPLGLRMVIGAPGDPDRDFDFLSSIEILVLDQAEILFAQNWEHLLHVVDHMHLQPQSTSRTDFSRVRPWCINGLSKFYRQTILLTSHDLPEFRSLFNNKCFNYRGKIRQTNAIAIGSIRNVIVQIPQVFHKLDVSSVQSSFDDRFKHFVNEILPQFKGPSMSHCMIYIPSYFDYVRLRNYFKSETINFVQICEYTKDSKIARARDMFYHSSSHFLLYSERGHFFRRTRIKGIRHLILYQPPYWPHLYSEIINLMQDANQNPRDGLQTCMSVTMLYTKYDILQLSAIIGTDRAAAICKSKKTFHTFMTGEQFLK